MSNVFFTSDTHFGHEKIILLCDRPFDDVDEMDETIIDNWNSVVNKDDIVWHLGDYALGDRDRGLGYLSRLSGIKRLIIGNHDKCFLGDTDGYKNIKKYQEAGFEVVVPYARIKLGGIKMNLSHFPYTGDHTANDRHLQWRLPVQDTPLVHGHTHQKIQFGERSVHVGVDAWGFYPVSFDVIIDHFKNPPPKPPWPQCQKNPECALRDGHEPVYGGCIYRDEDMDDYK